MDMNFLGKQNNSPDLKEKQRRLFSLFELQGKTTVLVCEDEDCIKKVKKVKNIRLTVIAKNRTEFLEKIKYKEAQVFYSDFIDTTIDSCDVILIETDFHKLTELENNMLYAEKNLKEEGQLVFFDFNQHPMDIDNIKKIIEVKFDRFQFIEEAGFHVVICLKKNSAQ